jgi:hypothetical protein
MVKRSIKFDRCSSIRKNIFDTIGSKSEHSRFIYSISFTTILKVCIRSINRRQKKDLFFSSRYAFFLVHVFEVILHGNKILMIIILDQVQEVVVQDEKQMDLHHDAVKSK